MMKGVFIAVPSHQLDLPVDFETCVHLENILLNEASMHHAPRGVINKV